MRISDWSSDVCSSDLCRRIRIAVGRHHRSGSVIAALRGGGDRSAKPHRLPHTARQQTNTPPSRNRSGSRLVSALDRLSSKLDLSVLPSNRKLRSAARRVATEVVSTCRYWWSRDHLTKKI